MSRAFGEKGHDIKMQFVLLLEERTDFTAKQQKMEELETISFSLFPRISHFNPKFFFILI